MTGFLQGVVERVQGNAQAPLRRRRPSVFEEREAAPAPLMSLEAGDTPLPARGPEPGYVLHRHEIHHHDRTVAQPRPRAESVVSPSVSASFDPPPVQLAMPMPLSLPPSAGVPTVPEARHPLPPLAPRSDAPVLALRHSSRLADPDAPLRSATQKRQTTDALEASPLRRARHTLAAATPAPSTAQALPLPPRLPPAQRAATPVAHPARRAALPTPSVTPVQVTIGSVEIRAHAPAPPPQRPPSRTGDSAARPSLDAYLLQRHGGPR